MTTAGEVLQLIRDGRATSRSQVGRLTGLSRTAVSARLDALLAAGLVLPGDDLPSTGGRPAGALLLNPDHGVVLAVAIGRSRAQLAVFDLGGRQLATDAVDHPVGSAPDAVLPEAARRLAALLASPATGPGTPRVLGTGISLPGTVDPARGVSLDSPVMVGWDGVDLAGFLADVGDAGPGAVLVGNDADVLARSERLGHAAHHRDLLVVKASTGLGLGILADGRVVGGHLGAAGEIGHTKVDAAAGRRCRCGDVGCLETVAGGWALVAGLGPDSPVGHVRDLVALAVAGDAAARGLVRDSGRALGEVLAVAINLLNPHAVVLGGDMAGAFDVLAAGVRESVYARASALATRDLLFLPSTFGDRAGLVGCAAMALDRVLGAPAVDEALRRPAASPTG